MELTPFVLSPLNRLGWPLDVPLPEGQIGRVIEELKHHYRVIDAEGEHLCKIVGKLKQHSDLSQLPKVGDWVLLDMRQGWPLITSVFPRKNTLSRKVPGKKTAAHVLVTNVDTVFVVHSLDPAQFNLNRLERMTVLCAQNEISYVIVLTKSDLNPETPNLVREVASRFSVPVVATSIIQLQGVESFQSHVHPQKTYTFFGASGVGKSSLINLLMGKDVQKTRSVREADYKGYHTTTVRTMLVCQNGGIVIDTPGLREAQLWDASREGLDQAFEDIAVLAHGCKFRDCLHTAESGCAVKVALLEGRLSEERYQHFLKIRAEQKVLKQRKWETRRR